MSGSISPWAMVASAGSNLVGSLISNGINNHWAEKNYKFQKEQFEYQKYLNNNQTQIQSADAQKAGINPLAMNGGSLSSGNYSNVSSSAENPLAGVSDVISAFANMKNQREMNDKNNETNSENVQKQLDSQYKIEREKIAQQNYEFQMDYILKSSNLSLAQREQMRKEAWDNYIKERDAANLNEQKYEFDVSNERLVHELEQKMKSFKVNQISSAFDTWRKMQLKNGNDVKTSGSDIVGIYNILKDGISTIRDVIDNNTWNKDQKAFWAWFNENYDLDGSYKSEYSRK